jgi:hypothetical protein
MTPLDASFSDTIVELMKKDVLAGNNLSQQDKVRSPISNKANYSQTQLLVPLESLTLRQSFVSEIVLRAEYVNYHYLAVAAGADGRRLYKKAAFIAAPDNGANFAGIPPQDRAKTLEKDQLNHKAYNAWKDKEDDRTRKRHQVGALYTIVSVFHIPNNHLSPPPARRHRPFPPSAEHGLSRKGHWRTHGYR